MIWLLKYLSSVSAVLGTINLPPFFKKLLTSIQDHTGKASGKRLAGANAMIVVSYIIIYCVHKDKEIDGLVVGELLAFAAAAFAIDYLPSSARSKKIEEAKKEGE